MTTKKCTKCGLAKPLEDYNKGNGKHNRKSECRVCTKKRAKEYKQRPEVKEKRRDYQKSYRESLSSERKTDLYLRRKDKVNEWLKNNPEFVRAKRKKDYTRKRELWVSAGPLCSSSIHHIEEYNTEHFSSTNLHCEYCSSLIVGFYDLEHVIPLCRGGTHKTENLAISCSGCNRGTGGKHTKLLEEWKPELQTYINERNQKWKNK